MECEYKVFKDVVHGYIEIPKPLVSLFIDTPIFQRLRNIEQTGMRVLFPSASHDRFVHSLGTYHLGVKAFYSLKRNIRTSSDYNTYFRIKKSERDSQLFWDKFETLFHIACLMHDCAHAPFSHTLEYMYNLKSDLDLELLKAINSKDFYDDYKYVHPKEHERVSAIIVKRYYSDAIKEVITNCINKKSISKIELNKCVEFVARAITGIKYRSKKDIEHQMLNCFISLLNSSIDVDALDYIIRDAKLSGIDNYAVDIERLLGSVNIIEVTDFNDHHFTNQKLDNAIVKIDDDSPLPRFIGEFRGHATGEIYSANFSGALNGFVSIEGNGVFDGNIVKKDELPAVVSGNTYSNVGIISSPDNDVQFSFRNNMECKICSAKLRTNKDFSARIDSDSITFDTPSLKIDATVNGRFTGRILGKLESYEPGITIGYHKSSLGVIENVINARNYEYLWIYGHHKVVYYSNYLLKELVHQASETIMALGDIANLLPALSGVKSSDGVISAIMSVSNFSNDTAAAKNAFFLINDNDTLALLKNVYYLNKEHDRPNQEYHKLYEELQTRTYKKSIWKSQAEYNILLGNLSLAEKEALYANLVKTDLKKRKYGSVPDDWKEEFNKHELHNVIWVENTVTLKNLKPDETFILFKDTPVRFRDAVLNTSNSGSSTNEFRFEGFYLYYEGKHIGKQKLAKIGAFLATKAREYYSLT